MILILLFIMVMVLGIVVTPWLFLLWILWFLLVAVAYS